ncbi:hypothetical protein WJX81_005629 [Elliptochloris bilobata]|uniref:Rhodanese domain-containing protein n=1 Tax=Elliptochloris bilobata TaxID=381761 RepID=A0AAW1RQU1_9CHLO
MALAQPVLGSSAHQRVAHAGTVARRPAAAALKARSLPVRLISRQQHQTCCAATAGKRSDYTKDLSDAEKRWEGQIREGKVKSINAKIAGDLMKDGWTLLDVRPPYEIAKAGIEGATEVPVYIVDEDMSVGLLLKKASNLGLGGWWLGGTHMKPNAGFIGAVQAQVPKDAKLIVTCQKGLRSLAAAEQLSRAGYGTLAWINGGLDTAKKTDLPVKGEFDDLRYGGIGGLSELLGWTDVQREKSSGFLGGGQNIIKAAIVVLILDGLWAAWGIYFH